MLFEVKKIDHYTLSFWKIEDFLDEKSLLKKFNLELTNFSSKKRQQEKLTTYLQLQYHFGEKFSTLTYTETGKPELKNLDFSISISHKFPWHLLLFSSKKIKIGVDIEKIDVKMLKIYPRFLTKFEHKMTEKLSDQEKIFYFTLFWAAKECAIKIWDKTYLISQLSCIFFDQKNQLIQIQNFNSEILNLTFFTFKENYVVVFGSKNEVFF